MHRGWWNTISGARWFQGRGRGGWISSIHPLPWYTRAGHWPAIRSEIAEVTYPDGDIEHYHLVVGYLDAEDQGRDIASHPGLLRLLWRAWQSPSGFSPNWDAALPRDLDPVPIASEQSNTSVQFGDDVVVKFFRRLEGNAEVNLLRSLSSGRSTRVPSLYGSVSTLVPGLGSADLAMIVRRVEAQGDGWVAATEAASRSESFATDARRLGADLRALHRDLASAFSTETVPGRQLVDQLATSGSELGQDIHSLSPAVALLEMAKDRDWSPQVVQRVHADMHLGQCLDGPNGWVFVDFEGEPLRALENRRIRDSVWRDIAGMLRSFDYAARVARAPDRRRWTGECKDAFLEGYGGTSWLSEMGQVYALEKAIYEVAYERKYRPEWVSIPLEAVAEIAEEVAAWAAPGQEWEWHTI